ncbi:MAG TPA: AraC family transcriptional regulator [Thermoanaerobaculia bacterium]|nr:AraC family transcriptional regulator [Thermoanaerobaculia bacterium]
MSTSGCDSTSIAHWQTRSAAVAAPALGPVRWVPVGRDATVPVPVCNNDGQVVLEAEGVRVGLFRASPGQPSFRFSGIPGEHIVVFQKGAVRLQRLGGRPYVADPLCAHFLDPDQIYFRDGLAAEHDWATWLGLQPALVATLLGVEPVEERLRWPFHLAPVSAATYLLQCELVAAIREGTASRSLLERGARLLACRAVAEARRLGSRPGDEPAESAELVERARALLVAKCTSNRAVADLAAELGCSVSHLGRLLRRRFGASPHGYRIQLRLRRALALLGEGAPDLADLALACGFASHSHFTTSFRAAFGITPSSLRRRAAAARLAELVSRLERAGRGRGAARSPVPGC